MQETSEGELASKAGVFRPRRIIALFSDGTGNSSGKLFKTNVWRLYDALDLRQLSAEQLDQGMVQQVAYYDDGVGTSGFKPLAILGGVFGWGLKRNVLDLYTFLCRNYQPGDEIYAFGFSRGAFTIRVLIGLVVTQGLIACKKEEELARYARDAYRANRRRFNPKTMMQPVVTALRDLRDVVIGTWRNYRGQPLYREVEKIHPAEIAFVGVWDTVAAYGMPIAELTRGIDKWIWPLSMPNYILSGKVRQARHALTLDDERDTFHPLLWDERAEKDDREGRLQQVWFCGMHSDVGGGYPDDSLAYVSLKWMLEQLAPAGLRFRDDKLASYATTWNQFGPMHDSRSGLAAYYRYQPRKLSARIDPPDPTTRIMRNPDLGGHGLLKTVKIHESVLNRLRSGTDHYAPIVLPEAYFISGDSGSSVPASSVERSPRERANRQEWVWNDVWRRRITYFSNIGASLTLAALPWYEDRLPEWTYAEPDGLIPRAVMALGMVLPGFAEYWIHSFARRPIVFGALLVIIIGLLIMSGRLQTRIQDRMRSLWDWTFGTAEMNANPQAYQDGTPDDWVYRLRTSDTYQRTLQLLKWEVAPGLFGALILLAVIAGLFWAGKTWPILIPLLLLVLLLLGIRAALAHAETSEFFCPAEWTEYVRGPLTADRLFTTDSVCWATGWGVEKGARYRINLSVRQNWVDNTIPASPEGFGSERMSWRVRPFALLRRSILDPWFQPMIKIVSDDPDDPVHTEALRMRRAATGEYHAVFQAATTGALSLFVNDAMLPWGSLGRRFYDNNSGSAEVRIEPVK